MCGVLKLFVADPPPSAHSLGPSAIIGCFPVSENIERKVVKTVPLPNSSRRYALGFVIACLFSVLLRIVSLTLVLREGKYCSVNMDTPHGRIPGRI